MAEDQSNKEEEKFEFTAEGEILGYISLDQARLLAMQTARESPGEYGRRFRGAAMAFEVLDVSDEEDSYAVTLSFRPQGDFAGTPGREQFFIGKEGAVAHRQVLALPRSRRFPIPVLILTVLLTAATLFIVIGALTGRGFGGGREQAPVAVRLPTATTIPAPTEIPAVGVVPTDTPVPSDTPVPTHTPAPLPTSIPSATVAPTEEVSLLSLRGGVIADANPERTAIDNIKFTLISAAEAQDVVDLSPIGVVVSYLDDDQAVNCFPPARQASPAARPVARGPQIGQSAPATCLTPGSRWR